MSLHVNSVKRILSIVLLALLLSGTGGTYFFFRIVSYVNFVQIQHRLHRAEGFHMLTLIVVKPAEESLLHWKSNHKEFEYRGQLYDVASAKKAGTRTRYYCYHDLKEKRLLLAMAAKRKAQSRHNNHISKVLNISVVIPPGFKSHTVKGRWVDRTTCSERYTDNAVEILSPPPKYPVI